jgi:hypothetical protein
MRQVTKKVCSAFIDRIAAHSVNTITDGTRLALFGSTIAWWDDENPDVLWITFAGYTSPTTKERINGLCDLLGLGRPFYSKDSQLYFGSVLRPVDSREHIRVDVPLARRCRAADQTIAA